MTDTEDERKVDTKVMWYKSRIQAVPGQLVITCNRFTFKQDIVKTPIGGLIGTLLFYLKKRKLNGGEVLDENLKELTFKKGKQMGKLTFFLEVYTKNQREFRFLIDDTIFLNIKDLID